MSPSCATDLAVGSVSGPAAVALPALVRTLRDHLAGRAARAVLWFASPVHDAAAVAAALADAFPGACVAGCSSAGEFTGAGAVTGGIAAVALPDGVVETAAAGFGDLSDDAERGADAAVAAVEEALGARLRDLDPRRYLALLLVDGVRGDAEAVAARIGDAAPVLDVVGGCAAADLAADPDARPGFVRTPVALGHRVSGRGLALVVLRTAVPFRVVKSCAFVPSGRRLRVTRTADHGRTVLEFDHMPAVEAYADAVGIELDCVDGDAFLRHPLALVVDGRPWLRSPRAVVGDAIRFRSGLWEGGDVEVVNADDVVRRTREDLAAAVEELGGAASGAVLFDCVLRRSQLDAERAGDRFAAALNGLSAAGFHGNGGTWLGHVDQTLTGVVLGRP